LRTRADTPRSSTTLLEEPDPHGRVAMMLCESLLHVLVEQGVLPRQIALEAIDGVAELIEEAADSNMQAANIRAAAVMVDSIRQSFLHKD
jgi:hypothetical protein